MKSRIAISIKQSHIGNIFSSEDIMYFLFLSCNICCSNLNKYVVSKFYHKDISFMNKSILENILAILYDISCIGTDSFSYKAISMYNVTVMCN